MFDGSRKNLYWTSIGLFAASLIAPGIVLTSSSMPMGAITHNIWYGLYILVNGWIGIIYGQFAWFANILFGGAFLAAHYRRYQLAMILSLIACALGLQTITTLMYYDPESGHPWIVNYFGPGFFLWEASFGLMLIYSWKAFRGERGRT